MSPEKEARLIGAARVFEAAAHRHAQLAEKHSKLHTTLVEVQQQLEKARREAAEAEDILRAVACEGLPPLGTPGIAQQAAQQAAKLSFNKLPPVADPQAAPIIRVEDLVGRNAIRDHFGL